MSPIICETCYELFNSPEEYLSHYKAEHEQPEEEICDECGEVHEDDLEAIGCNWCGDEIEAGLWSVHKCKEEQSE